MHAQIDQYTTSVTMGQLMLSSMYALFQGLPLPKPEKYRIRFWCDFNKLNPKTTDQRKEDLSRADSVSFHGNLSLIE